MASLLDGYTVTNFYGTTVLQSYANQPALAITHVNDVRNISTGAGTHIAYIDTGSRLLSSGDCALARPGRGRSVQQQRIRTRWSFTANGVITGSTDGVSFRSALLSLAGSIHGSLLTAETPLVLFRWISDTAHWLPVSCTLSRREPGLSRSKPSTLMEIRQRLTASFRQSIALETWV